VINAKTIGLSGAGQARRMCVANTRASGARHAALPRQKKGMENEQHNDSALFCYRFEYSIFWIAGHYSNWDIHLMLFWENDI
jgi:hypothetical protein